MAVQIVRHQVSNYLRTEETDYESRGQEFESLRARQNATIQNKTANPVTMRP
jgi:hypothetical protein